MTDDHNLLNHQQLKKVARRQRQIREKQAGRTLDIVTTEAIERALELAPGVAEAGSVCAVIDVEVASVSEAKFVLKRINAVLQTEELLDSVRVWVWDATAHRSSALSDLGRDRGFELRIEGVPHAR